MVVPSVASDPGLERARLAEPIVALVIDSQPLFVAALGRLLAMPPICASLRAASRSDEGLEMLHAGGIHLVFCEVGATPLSGRELAALLHRSHPGLPVILLAARGDEGLLAEALPSGAAGLFTKDASVEEFMAGVSAVLAGHRSIASGLLLELQMRFEHRPGRDGEGGGHLSPAELEIIRMIGRADSVATIAATRGTSQKTVRNHLAKIYRKLEVHGRTEAVLWAARRGLTGGRP